MSGNHNHSLDRALSLVEAAASSGAHALKLQTYTADTITLDVSHSEFFIEDEKSLERQQSSSTVSESLHSLGMAPTDHSASQGTGDAMLQYSV